MILFLVSMQAAEAPQVRMAFDRGYAARQEIQRPGTMGCPLGSGIVLQGITEWLPQIGTKGANGGDLQ